MENQWIVKDAIVCKIKNSGLSFELLQEFIEDVIYKHPNNSILLKELSNIYVLVALKGSEVYLREGEKSWKDILTEHQYEKLKKHNKFILAYMLVEEIDDHYHFIEILDTIVPANNFARIMIQKYEYLNDYKVKLIPREIIDTSVYYWAKYLTFISKGEIDKDEVLRFINDLPDTIKDQIKWNCLIDKSSDISDDEFD